MIYGDRVIVVTGGGTDPRGNPLPVVDEGPFPAHVRPLRSSESVARGQPPLTAYYRLAMGRSGGDLLTPDGRIKWRGATYDLQGDVEPHHTLTGRLHHYEATLRRR